MAAAAIGCAWVSLPPPAFAPVATGIVLAWAWHFAQSLQRGRPGIRTLELNTTGGARCLNGLGQWRDAEVLPGSYVSRWLIVLILGIEGRRRRSLVLLPDSAAADDLRRLRAWLRWRLTQA
jgi:hypothetical protein